MFKRCSLFLLLSFSLIHAEIKELATMQDLCAPIAEALNSEKLPLVVFDIDDTIVTTQGYLGGTIWFMHELEKQLTTPGVTREQAIKQAIALYTHLQLNVPFKAVEEDAPAIILTLQMLGIPCMGLTARSFDPWLITPMTLVDRTFQQLAELEIDLSLAALSNDDLEFSNDKEKPARFSRGIIFNGQNNKGEMLLKYLKTIAYEPDMVIYIDDSANNVAMVHDALVAAGIPCTAFRYSAMDEINKSFDAATAHKELEAFLVEHPQSTAIA